MNETYIFGGYILTGGTLENGKAWQGINIMFATVRNGREPVRAEIGKASRLDSILEVVQNLTPGTPVEIFCAPGTGKITSIRPV